MVLIFKKYKDRKYRGITIGKPNNQSEALKMIRKYLKNNNKKFYYIRFWTKNDITTFDFGSHFEFFYLANDEKEKEVLKNALIKRRIRKGQR